MYKVDFGVSKFRISVKGLLVREGSVVASLLIFNSLWLLWLLDYCDCDYWILRCSKLSLLALLHQSGKQSSNTLITYMVLQSGQSGPVWFHLDPCRLSWVQMVPLHYTLIFWNMKIWINPLLLQTKYHTLLPIRYEGMVYIYFVEIFSSKLNMGVNRMLVNTALTSDTINMGGDMQTEGIFKEWSVGLLYFVNL